MNLRRQLLLVSLLTLVLPWAGCQFIRETESALRAGQQEMLAGTARAIAETLSNYPEEFPPARRDDYLVGDQLYAHPLGQAPEIDGYYDDWPLSRAALRTMRGADGPIRFVLGLHQKALYLYVDVADERVIYSGPGSAAAANGYSDRVRVLSVSPPYLEQELVFAAEAPGPVLAWSRDDYGFAAERTVTALWQDTPRGYQLEARIPLSLLGTNLGLAVDNTTSARAPGVRSTSFSARAPGPLAATSPELESITAGLVQPGMRLIVTDSAGWRVASVGELETQEDAHDSSDVGSAWLRIAYEALVESGEEAELAEPDPGGRETQGFIGSALGGSGSVSWYRSPESGRAVVAAAQPVFVGSDVAGAIVLQQGTDAILSLRNRGLARLLDVTLIATILVAGTLLGYATWLSRRIRRLSVAAEAALEQDDLRRSLPSALAGDEVGDLSRSFSSVLRQLADYNEYLKSLASKLSHELRTPLAIVTSSLENLEHEALSDAALDYAARASDGATRLRRILSAMSEASRVEELMAQAEPEPFDLAAVLGPIVEAYRDVYPERSFVLEKNIDSAPVRGAPELLVQLLDKLVDNAADFSSTGDTIRIGLAAANAGFRLTVTNPGPALPAKMGSQLFDSMVSVRPNDGRHLGLGLYVARLIAEGHGGRITAANTDDGVTFTVVLPGDASITERKGKNYG